MFKVWGSEAFELYIHKPMIFSSPRFNLVLSELERRTEKMPLAGEGEMTNLS